MKALGLRELFMIGALLAVLALIGHELLSPDLSSTLSYFYLVVAFIAGILFVFMGFDYYRIKFSFSLTFLVVVVFLYVLLTILTGASGVLLAIAIALTPYLGAYVGGLIHERSKLKATGSRARGVKVSLTRRLRATLYQLDATMWFFMLFGLSYLTAFMLVPILMVLVASFTPPAGGEWWFNFYRVLRTRDYVRFEPIGEEAVRVVKPPGGECIVLVTGVNYGPVLNSFIVASIVTTVATVLGVIVAYVLARYRFPGHTLLRIMAIVPLFNTPFINAYVVKLLWGPAGPISQLFKALTGCYLSVDRLAGVIVAQVFTFFPIVYLNAYTAFLNVDPSTEEQAENLGSKGFHLFRTVTLPLALPGIAAGSILVFVFSLEDIGAPIVFNERNLMAYRIFEGIITAHGFIAPEIAALGVLLLLAALTVFLAIRNYVSMRSYAMISRGGRWKPRVSTPSLLGLLAIYLGVFPLVAFAMLPQVCVVLISLGIMKPFAEGYRLVFTLPDKPLNYFEKILVDPAISRFIANTLIYAGTSVLLAVFLATAVGYSVARLKIKRIPSILDGLATSPLAIPGLVIALGYYMLFVALSNLIPGELGAKLSPASPAFEAWLVFIIAFSVRRLPYVVRSVFAGFQQIHEALEESAMNLGATRFKVVFGVLIPYIIGYVFSGALIGFIYMATEVSTSVTFGGMREDQAPLTYYMKHTITGAAGEGPYLVAAMGTLLILIQLAVVLTVVFIFKQRYAFIGV